MAMLELQTKVDELSEEAQASYAALRVLQQEMATHDAVMASQSGVAEARAMRDREEAEALRAECDELELRIQQVSQSKKATRMLTLTAQRYGVSKDQVQKDMAQAESVGMELNDFIEMRMLKDAELN
jgi:hypothetical protein